MPNAVGPGYPVNPSTPPDRAPRRARIARMSRASVAAHAPRVSPHTNVWVAAPDANPSGTTTSTAWAVIVGSCRHRASASPQLREDGGRPGALADGRDATRGARAPPHTPPTRATGRPRRPRRAAPRPRPSASSSRIQRSGLVSPSAAASSTHAPATGSASSDGPGRTRWGTPASRGNAEAMRRPSVGTATTHAEGAVPPSRHRRTCSATSRASASASAHCHTWIPPDVAAAGGSSSDESVHGSTGTGPAAPAYTTSASPVPTSPSWTAAPSTVAPWAASPPSQDNTASPPTMGIVRNACAPAADHARSSATESAASACEGPRNPSIHTSGCAPELSGARAVGRRGSGIEEAPGDGGADVVGPCVEQGPQGHHRAPQLWVHRGERILVQRRFETREVVGTPLDHPPSGGPPRTRGEHRPSVPPHRTTTARGARPTPTRRDRTARAVRRWPAHAPHRRVWRSPTGRGWATGSRGARRRPCGA